MIPATGWVSTFGVREGVAVLVRRTDEPEYQARLMRAAEVLAATDHPGVERLVAIETDDDGTTLTTHFAGGRSLAGSPPSDNMKIVMAFAKGEGTAAAAAEAANKIAAVAAGIPTLFPKGSSEDDGSTG